MSVYELVRCRAGMMQGRADTVRRVVMRENQAQCSDFNHVK